MLSSLEVSLVMEISTNRLRSTSNSGAGWWGQEIAPSLALSVCRSRRSRRCRRFLESLFCFALLILPFQQSFCSDAGFEAELKVIGGAHRMFRLGVDQPVLEIEAWSTNGAAHDIVAGLDVADIFYRTAPGSPLPITIHLPADRSKARTTLPLPFGIGYYTILVTLTEGAVTLTHSTDLGVVWPPYSGVRPNSLFSSNVAPRQGEDLQLLETIGIKVQRTHFIPGVAT